MISNCYHYPQQCGFTEIILYNFKQPSFVIIVYYKVKIAQCIPIEFPIQFVYFTADDLKLSPDLWNLHISSRSSLNSQYWSLHFR